MLNAILSYINVDLVIVGIAITASAIIGTVVFLNDRKSITNITFLIFSLSSIFWNICNYLFYQPNHSPEFALLLLRLVIFFAVWYCFFLFQFFYVFPEKKMLFLKKYLCLLFLAISVSFIALTPIVFKEITSFSSDGRVATVLNGFGIYIFGVGVVSLILSSFYTLITKLLKTKQDTAEREQFTYILIGAVITFTLHIIFNMVLPAFFNISQFTALGAVFTLPFGIFTSLAIIKYKLFNVKVIATELITFALWIFILVRTLIAQTTSERIIDGVLFFITVIVGTLLIRSVMKEVEQREELAKLNIDLENLLKQRESLVHLVTHKVKGSFTRSKYIFAGLLDGTFGEINPVVKKYAEQGLESDNMGIETVDLVLNAANMEKGLIKYDMKIVDFKELVLNSISEKKISAEAKGLKIETEIKEDKDDTYNLLGDPIWLKEAVNNLIENSIKYTKEGKITVGLEDGNGKIKLSVKDNGVGITGEDKKNLFTEGGRGRDSVKVNVDSTGYGLYTVKLIVEAHKGRVWAESEGAGKGSAFYVELPTV
jgi:signal transduction histidine kinase